MQEGIMSLMQMAKTSAALQKLADVNDLTFQFFAIQPRVASASLQCWETLTLQNLGQLVLQVPVLLNKPFVKNYKGFQRSEFLLEKGMLDMVVKRQNMRHTGVIS